LQLQYNDGAGDVYQNIKTATVYKGTWTLLEGQLTVPSHAKDVKIYVETEFKKFSESAGLDGFLY